MNLVFEIENSTQILQLSFFDLYVSWSLKIEMSELSKCISLHRALLADRNPNPNLCAAEPSLADFENGCRYCKIYTGGATFRPTEEAYDESLELELGNKDFESVSEELLCPTASRAFNAAMWVPFVITFVLCFAFFGYW